MPVNVSFNPNQTRAAFRFQHPKGNILTCDMLDALRTQQAAVWDYEFEWDALPPAQSSSP